MPSEGSTRAEILPGCPSLDRGSRVPEVGFEPRTFRLTGYGTGVDATCKRDAALRQLLLQGHET
ncbi:hypothetical protein T265_08522 [Opisthorchis viverrini]|uniref:Uncharacterized protein n=1 Tax=Opisthorchis viverrini TaxID=6198 RepID=A0A074Z8T8_OPIVI|nr:hypothetical protein T265_08522 [Opisthorchis viverrini]KER23621.1 hypothetical protein T265_08522 [Opisthorchis viverrini]